MNHCAWGYILAAWLAVLALGFAVLHRRWALSIAKPAASFAVGVVALLATASPWLYVQAQTGYYCGRGGLGAGSGAWTFYVAWKLPYYIGNNALQHEKVEAVDHVLAESYASPTALRAVRDQLDGGELTLEPCMADRVRQRAALPDAEARLRDRDYVEVALCNMAEYWRLLPEALLTKARLSAQAFIRGPMAGDDLLSRIVHGGYVLLYLTTLIIALLIALWRRNGFITAVCLLALGHSTFFILTAVPEMRYKNHVAPALAFVGAYILVAAWRALRRPAVVEIVCEAAPRP
jgi:hypothetical protein